MALPDALLGSALKAYFDQGYAAGTGTFVDAKGIASNFTQSTSGNRPTWNTSTAPSGRGLLSFPGGGAHSLSGGNIASGSLPSYGSNYWIEFCIFKRPTAGTSVDEEHIINYDGNDLLALFFGKLYRLGCNNASVNGTSVTYAIMVTNASTNAVTMYVNGTSVGTGSTDNTASGQRAQWVDLKYIGNRNNGSQPFAGLVGCMGWAVQTTWTTTDTANLYAAMQEWWTTAPGGGGGTVSLAGSAAAAASTAAAAKVARSLRIADAGAASTAAAIRRAAAFAASAAGVASLAAAAAIGRRMAGTAPGAASTAAGSRVARSLAASVVGAAFTSGSVGASRALAGASPAAAATAASLGAARGLGASTAGQTTTGASVRVARSFGGTANGVASTVLAIDVGGVSEVFFAATGAGSASTSSGMIVARAFVGSAAGGAAPSIQSVSVARRLGATAAAFASTSSASSVVRRFVATSAGFATTTASLGDDPIGEVPGGIATIIPIVTVATIEAFPNVSQALFIGGLGSHMITIKRNDRETIRAKLVLNGEPAPLAGASVKFLMKSTSAMASAPPKVDASATIVDAAQSLVEYACADGDTDTVDTFRAEFEVTYPNGKTRTFPTEGYLTVRVVADLG